MSGIDASVAGKRCLVLDDEFLIALDIQQILELAGAESVTCVGNAAAAMAAIQGTEFDLAILDVRLGGPGGGTATSLSVAGTLAKLGTPFVLLTGMRGDDPHLAQFPQAPVVTKPYETKVLLDAVRAALAG